MIDVVIVGSGASGVHAAWPLVEAGLSVLMLDVGNRDDRYAGLIPDKPFTRIRREDAGQHRYFLGDEFEGVPLRRVRVGAQLTPPRRHVSRGAAGHEPLEARGFAGLESLAAGGLGAGWGAGVARFTAADLARTPLKPADLAPHYDAVERRIGISGEQDDLSAELGDHAGMMPPLPVDAGAARIFDAYRGRRAELNAIGLRLGVSRLAACSQAFQGRGPHRLDDLDFWADKARAVYRPQWTLDDLRKRSNFWYMDRWLVQRFRERDGGVEVEARNVDSGESETVRASRLVLAAGVMGTARIVLRSLGLYDRPVPLVANPYTYAPCVNVGMLGREASDARHSLAQLTAVLAPPGERPLHTSVYSYGSLLTFKLMKEAPIAAASARVLMRALIPALAILGIHHADDPTPAKRLRLVRGAREGEDRLVVEYGLSDAERARIDAAERLLLRAFRRMGCLALKRIDPGNGSSIHYGGTFPMAADPADLQTSSTGLLSGTGAVYLADGSVLPDLPAKGPTLTLMAGADRIGTMLARSLAR